MKIIFVNPPITKEERYGDLAVAGSYAPPLGICSLAAVTREKGYVTRIIDSPIQGLDLKTTSDQIQQFAPAVVGITSTTSTFTNAAKLATQIKAGNDEITVIVGGVHISALPEESLQQYKAIDIGVIGEAEDTIIELLEALKNRFPLQDIRGITYRQNGRVIVTNPRPLIKDLDKLPLPAWDLLAGFPDRYNVQAQSVASFPSTSVCTSRGCTGKCTFCDRRIFGSRLRAHSADYVIRLIKDLYENYGIRDIQFEDDNFMLFKKRLIRICDQLKRENINITWSCQARVDLIDANILAKAKSAGCWMVLYGIESGSQKVLDLMCKQISLAKIEKAIDLTHKAGLLCKGFFITGFLNEDHESLQETYGFIKKSRLDDISFHYYVPFPGSAAYEMAAQYGDQSGDFHDMTYYRPIFIPKRLTAEDLTAHIKACYSSFYLRPRTIYSYLKRIKNPAHLSYLIKSAAALIKYVFISRKA